MLALSPIPLPAPLTFRAVLEVEGDAGPLGFGSEGPIRCAGVWRECHRERSTNWKELLAWRMFTKLCRGLIGGKLWHYLTDSEVAASYINGTIVKSYELSRMTVRTIRFLQSIGSRCRAVVVSQERISKSDRLSRILEKGESLSMQELKERIESFQAVQIHDLWTEK